MTALPSDPDVSTSGLHVARARSGRALFGIGVAGLALCVVDLALRQVARRSLADWLGLSTLALPPMAVALAALSIGTAAALGLLWLSRRDIAPRVRLADRLVVLALGVLLAAGLVAQLRMGARLQSDGFYYYAYLRSLAFDHDVDFTNDYQLLGLGGHAHLFGPTETGYAHSAWTIGPAIAWSPFFAAGHAVATRLNASGAGVNPDGTSFPYRQAVCVAGLFYGLLGTWFVYRLAALFFARGLAAAAAFVTIAGSFMLWYLVQEPTMTHAPSMAVVALFTLAWARTRGDRRWQRWAGLGLLAGLMTLIRWQNLIFALLPAIEAALALWTAARTADARAARSILLGGIVFTAAAVIGFLPQMLAWKAIYGQFLAVSPLGPEIRWWQPHLADILWSSRNGLLATSPVVYLGLVGLLLLIGSEPAFALPAIATIVVMTWFNASIQDWWGSAGFGMRRFDGILPLAAVGLAAFVRAMAGTMRRWPPLFPAAVLAALVLWNLSFVGAARAGAVRPGEAFSFGELAGHQARLVHQWLGYPFSYPANLLYAFRNGVSPARYDLLGPNRFLADPARPYGRIDIGSGDEIFLLDGWHAAERDGATSFRWAEPSAGCLVPLDHPAALDVQIRLRPLTVGGTPPQAVRVLINGVAHGPFELEEGWQDLRFPTDERTWRSGLNRLRLESAAGYRPADTHGGTDTRLLSVAADVIRVSVASGGT